MTISLILNENVRKITLRHDKYDECENQRDVKEARAWKTGSNDNSGRCLKKRERKEVIREKICFKLKS